MWKCTSRQSSLRSGNTKMTKKCTIFSGGEAVSAQCVAEYKSFIDDSLVISADKGYKLAQAVGVKSDIIMGDFDSAEKPVLTVGMEGTYAPYTYHDENGTLTGFEVDMANAIGEKMGYDVQFVETEWDSITAALDAGNFDVVMNQVTITDERKEKFDFSTPYRSEERRVGKECRSRWSPYH